MVVVKYWVLEWLIVAVAGQYMRPLGSVSSKAIWNYWNPDYLLVEERRYKTVFSILSPKSHFQSLLHGTSIYLHYKVVLPRPLEKILAKPGPFSVSSTNVQGLCFVIRILWDFTSASVSYKQGNWPRSRESKLLRDGLEQYINHVWGAWDR